MFKRNKTKENLVNKEESQELKFQVDQDLLVRNMPSLHEKKDLSKKNTNNHEQVNYSSGTSFKFAPASDSHKKVGIVIIIGGIILIIALVYLSYLFIIKPTLNSSTQSIPSQEQFLDNQSLDNLNIPAAILIEDGEIVSEVEPVVVEFGVENFIDDDELIMAEEASFLDVSNWEPVVDSDGDGLSDEEELVLGTDPYKTDTNDNGYPDLLEILNNYNPAGTGRLENNSNLNRYNDRVFDYGLLYPKNWEFSILDSNRALIFNLPDESLIQISVQENTDNQNITDWYSSSFPNQLIAYDKIKIKPTWEGIESLDSLHVYLTDDGRDYIYTISYIPAISGRLVYPNIFKMMIDSFTITE
jgi:hypothetical protein